MAAGGIDIAGDDGQQIVEIVGDAAGQLADRLHLLRLAKRFFGLLAVGDRGGDPRLQRLVQLAQCLLGELAVADLALRGLVEPGIVDRDRRLAGDPDQQLLVTLGEAGRLLVAEEQAADHLAGARDDRHGEIGGDRQMALGHAAIRRRCDRSAGPW